MEKYFRTHMEPSSLLSSFIFFFSFLGCLLSVWDYEKNGCVVMMSSILSPFNHFPLRTDESFDSLTPTNDDLLNYVFWVSSTLSLPHVSSKKRNRNDALCQLLACWCQLPLNPIIMHNLHTQHLELFVKQTSIHSSMRHNCRVFAK